MRPLVIGVAGGSGSGKSTVAHRVAEALGPAAVTLCLDGYYRDFTHLSPEARRRVNWDHPNAIDFDLFATQLGQLAAGQPIDKPVYDFALHAPAPGAERVAPRPVVVCEGILLFADARVRDLCDIKVFVDADADLRLARRIRRDMKERGRPLDDILDQYLTTVRPMHQQFVEPTRAHADIIVADGGHNAAAIEMIVAGAREKLADGCA